MPLTSPFQESVPMIDSRCGMRMSVFEPLGEVFERADREDREARALRGLVERLGGGHLHRLLVLHQHPLGVAERAGQDRGDERERQHLADRARVDLGVALAQQPEAEIASTSNPPVHSAAKIVCGNASSTVELVSTAKMFLSSARWVVWLIA